MISASSSSLFLLRSNRSAADMPLEIERMTSLGAGGPEWKGAEMAAGRARHWERGGKRASTGTRVLVQGERGRVLSVGGEGEATGDGDRLALGQGEQGIFTYLCTSLLMFSAGSSISNQCRRVRLRRTSSRFHRHSGAILLMECGSPEWQIMPTTSSGDCNVITLPQDRLHTASMRRTMPVPRPDATQPYLEHAVGTSVLESVECGGGSLDPVYPDSDTQRIGTR